MKKTRYTEEQVVKILGELKNGKSIAETGRQYGVSEQTIHRWRAKFGDLGVNEVKRLRELEAENRKLKDIVAQQALDNVALKELLSKKW
jgi:putative transposase